MDNANPTTTRFVLFCKYPVPGRVKTRLIPQIGPEAAARLQRRLLERTLQIIRKAAPKVLAEIEVRYDGARKADFEALLGGGVSFRPQGEGGLGERMRRAFADAFDQQAQKVVLVGADIPELSVDILTGAITLLSDHDVVIGPAEDGGYYLIAMRCPIPSLFDNVPWGTAAVLQKTTEKLEMLRVRYALTTPLYDLDRPEDLKRATSFMRVTARQRRLYYRF